jgi:5'-deoxynucleotidase YfbR-like HD superfamily hydrolase
VIFLKNLKFLSIFISFTSFVTLLSQTEFSPEIHRLIEYVSDDLTSHIGLPPILKKVKNGLQIKMREGYFIRGVPREFVMTILTHSLRVAKAAKIYGLHFPEINPKEAELKSDTHDFCEWGKVPDYTPGDVSPDVKFQMEKVEMEDLVKILGPKYQIVLDSWLEYTECKKPIDIMIHDLDKMDAAIGALHYQSVGLGDYTRMEEFYPYARKKVKDQNLIHIMDTLLEREFPEISVWEQYLYLLEVNGDKDIFQKTMNTYSEKNNP